MLKLLIFRVQGRGEEDGGFLLREEGSVPRLGLIRSYRSVSDAASALTEVIAELEKTKGILSSSEQSSPSRIACHMSVILFHFPKRGLMGVGKSNLQKRESMSERSNCGILVSQVKDLRVLM